jgi:hypothetical protein
MRQMSKPRLFQNYRFQAILPGKTGKMQRIIKLQSGRSLLGNIELKGTVSSETGILFLGL